jgi:hypothetical protein
MSGLKFLQSIIDTNLIDKNTNNNVESASYKSGDNIVVLEGDLKDDQITHGAKKYYKQNGAIIRKFEGQFTDNQLTSPDFVIN